MVEDVEHVIHVVVTGGTGNFPAEEILADLPVFVDRSPLRMLVKVHTRYGKAGDMDADLPAVFVELLHRWR